MRWRFVAKLFIVLCIVISICNFLLIDWYRVSSNSMVPALPTDCLLLTSKSVSTPGTASLFAPSVKKNDILVFKRPSWVESKYSKENDFFVKRCIGLPGDTVHILRPDLPDRNVVSIPGQATTMYLFPQDTLFAHWTIASYGPIWVPKKKSVLSLTPFAVRLYQKLIRYENPDIRIDGDVLKMNGHRLQQYTFLHDYYFMIGDNFLQSKDSRLWGCIPDELLLGKVIWHS